MYLYLAQHAEAKREDEDPSRGLTGKGFDEIRKVSAYAARLGLRVGEIAHSGKKRAAETAGVLGEALKPPKGVREADWLNPTDDPRIWAGRLADAGHDIMLTGHLPHLSRLASLLLSGDAEKGIISFEMASIVCLGRDDSMWSVKWMITPGIIL